MKKIKIDNEELQYEIGYQSDYDTQCEWTSFYQGTTTIKKKRFFFFGNTIEIQVPKKIFTLNFSIENPNFTKEEIKATIIRQLKLLNRAEQIKKGEII